FGIACSSAIDSPRRTTSSTARAAVARSVYLAYRCRNIHRCARNNWFYALAESTDVVARWLEYYDTGYPHFYRPISTFCCRLNTSLQPRIYA
ncbi:hypothetical protein WG66_009234, partial [Moniliophthora roreri]